MILRFEWDDETARRNLERHGVSFEDAQAVFDDPLATVRTDDEHSHTEEREVIAGTGRSGRLLLVCFTRRDHSFRIISARELTKSERQAYEENRT